MFHVGNLLPSTSRKSNNNNNNSGKANQVLAQPLSFYSHNGAGASPAEKKHNSTAFCRVDAHTGTVSKFQSTDGNSSNYHHDSNNSNNNNNNAGGNHLSVKEAVEARQKQEHIFTGRRKNPAYIPSANGSNSNNGLLTAEGSVLKVPWAESAPGAPVVSTTRDMYQSAEDRDLNFKKHLRKQFRQFNLEHLIPSGYAGGAGKDDDDDDSTHNNINNNNSSLSPGDDLRRRASQLTELQRSRRKQQNSGVRDLKLTTLPNIQKRLATLGNAGSHKDALDQDGNRFLGNTHFAPTIDEIGQDKEQNQRSSMNLHTAGHKTRLEPFLVYEDEVARLPAVPTVGITYTGEKVEDQSEIVFPWDRPRVGADGAGKLARREARRLVTQRRLEFAEQFLPAVCSGVTTAMSRRVADQFQGARGIGQPQPLALGALENATIRAGMSAGVPVSSLNNHPIAAASGSGSGRAGVGGGGGGSSKKPLLTVNLSMSEAERQHEQMRMQRRMAEVEAAAAARKKAGSKVERIKQTVDEIVNDHARSLKRHELVMQIAVASL